ncbi:MAG TPA: hypothetical protein DCF84_06845 [Bacteroidetes bacterium]|nr:hypothetical protein [Bacteroidota bacterium]
MLRRLTFYTLLFLYNPLLYGQDYALGSSNTFREVTSFWLLHPADNSPTKKNLRLDGRWNHHPLSPNLYEAGLRLTYRKNNQSILLVNKATGFPKHSRWKLYTGYTRNIGHYLNIGLYLGGSTYFTPLENSAKLEFGGSASLMLKSFISLHLLWEASHRNAELDQLTNATQHQVTKALFYSKDLVEAYIALILDRIKGNQYIIGGRIKLQSALSLRFDLGLSPVKAGLTMLIDKKNVTFGLSAQLYNGIPIQYAAITGYEYFK